VTVKKHRSQGDGELLLRQPKRTLIRGDKAAEETRTAYPLRQSGGDRFPWERRRAGHLYIHGYVSMGTLQNGSGRIFRTIVQAAEAPGRQVVLSISRNIDLASIGPIEADAAQALDAAESKHKYKLGYADSFAATLAVTLKATLVSADSAFERLGKTLKWVRLPKYAQ
jgi:hypothetical protein